MWAKAKEGRTGSEESDRNQHQLQQPPRMNLIIGEVQIDSDIL